MPKLQSLLHWYDLKAFQITDIDQCSTKIKTKLKRGKRVGIDLINNHYNLVKKTNTLIKRMKIENTVYTFAHVNCRLKVMNKKNGEEAFFDNLER